MWFVVHNAREGRPYEEIVSANPIFSPDGKRLAYIAQSGKKQLVVVDGKEEKLYDSILEESLVFSPDGKHTAYIAQQVKNRFVVIDGKERRESDITPLIGMGRIVFDSPDTVRYIAVKGNHIFHAVEKIE
jgi:sugar lactone lactonase YvrE